MRIKAISRLLFVVGVLTWVVLFFTDMSVVFSVKNNLTPEIPVWFPAILFNLFLLTLYYYYKFKIDRDEQLSFVDLLWRVFAAGLIATVISLLFRLIEYLLGATALTNNIAYKETMYLINLGLMAFFLLAAFTSWKRLILYQKSKWLLRLWAVFEYALLIALFYNSLVLPPNKWIDSGIMIFFVVMGLILSANMKWVAFLNFRQKWTSLLLILLTIFYLLYCLFTTTSLADVAFGQRPLGFVDHREHIFFQSLLIFVITYSIFSFLVILFNLPTTSVFEQKLEEVVNFQRISQSIQTEQSEESVYNILLETSVSSVFADAGWLETNDNNTHRVFTSHISEKEASDIIAHLNNRHVTGVLDQSPDKTKNLSKHLASLKGSRFRSILAFPIYVKGENIGTLALLKELPDGFNKEMTKLISTFANQAGISIENFRLLEEALQGERYKEELKIAKNVQKSLLPQVLEQDAHFEIAAFSESADEVGGDYYDTLRVSASETALIIADVSGKGTTAAFHMSQMKGIFHSLAQDCVEPDEFMARANKALIYCLERSSFISAIFFLVDTQTQTVRYARAGHCPVLYYSAGQNKAEYFKDKGVALGVVRNNSYKSFIQSNQFTYKPGDVMVLYTDGITEAKSVKGEEFGYERLTQAVLEVKTHEPKQIQEHLIGKLYEFSGTKNINDDYTTMIIRFKE